MGMEVQPAKKSYFFGKGYTDLGNTIKEAWALNIQSAKDQMAMAGITSMIEAIHLVAAICIFVFGSIITAITSALHILILFSLFLIVYIGFAVVWLIDRIYIYANKIKNICPNPDCQSTFLIPVYECPNCKARHTMLVPSQYGILHRTCECGAKLPTTFMNGRGQLPAYCPKCGHSLSGDTASKQYAFPVIGGASVGKTCYINMAIEQLATQVAPAQGWQMHFIDQKEEKDHANAMQALNNGIRLPKTELSALTAYQMELDIPSEKIGRRIYVYDISGEMFSTSSDIQNNLAYSYANGFVFVIDPLTLIDYVTEVQDKVDILKYGASAKDFNDILNIMLINLEKMFNLKDKDLIKRDLAVVINKMDIPGLEEKIGQAAVSHFLEDHGTSSRTEARDELCREFLTKYGAGNFVRTAESKFKKVRYFTCSALGHNEEGTKFEGKNVTEPILWLLAQADPAIKLKQVS